MSQPLSPSRLAQLALYALTALAGLLLARLTSDAPLAPAVARGWLQADALSALTLIALGAHGLVALVRGPGAWGQALACCLLALASIVGHLGALAALLAGAGLALAGPRRLVSPALLGPALAGLGLALVGAAAGEWRYGAPGAGAGLTSLSFALVLLGALVAAGGPALALGRVPAPAPLAALACLVALLRLFSLGPWNLGWLLAALIAGGALALGAAWQAAAAPTELEGWLGAYLAGLALAGAGLGSGAGVTVAGYALLAWPLVRLGLGAGQGPWLWLLAGAVPLTAPFMLAWMAVAAAVAGGLTLLAAALWAAALLAASPVVRLARAATAQGGATGLGAGEGAETGDTETGGQQGSVGVSDRRAGLAAGALSLALGLGAPAVIAGLLGPLVAQLQGGLTPFGTLELWPWAGLLALDAGRQPAATLPSLALAALMLVLSALCWVGLRLLALRGRP